MLSFQPPTPTATIDAIRDFAEELQWCNAPKVSLYTQLQERTTLLCFWSASHFQSLNALALLSHLQQSYCHKPLAFIAIHTPRHAGETTLETVRQILLSYELNLPAIQDSQRRMWQLCGMRHYPAFALVSPSGTVAALDCAVDNKAALEMAIELSLNEGKRQRLNPLPIATNPASDAPHQRLFLKYPGKIAIDPVNRHLFCSNSTDHRILLLQFEGAFLKGFGSGQAGFRDGLNEMAQFYRPQGIALVNQHLFVADSGNHALRQIDLLTGQTTTLDQQAQSSPWDLVYYRDHLFLSMPALGQIWRYDLSSKKGAPINLPSEMVQPTALCLGDKCLYICDSSNGSIARFDLESGRVDILITAEHSKLSFPTALAWLPRQRALIAADSYDQRLKWIDCEKRQMKAWVGTGQAGYRDGSGGEAQFNHPLGLALSIDGRRLFVADSYNHALRVVDINSKCVNSMHIRGQT